MEAVRDGEAVRRVHAIASSVRVRSIR